MMKAFIKKRLLSVGLAAGLGALAAPLSGATPTVRNSGNPLATTDQNEVHAQALRVFSRPEVQKARALVEMLFRRVVHNDPPVEAWASFDEMLTDYTYNYALKGVADPNYPRVIHVYTQPHKWRGADVPGSRWGGNNPDNVNRIIPIDGQAHYRLDGRRIGAGPSEFTFQLVDNYETVRTLAFLPARDIDFKADGTFSITIGPEPANGRRNYIQTKPESLFLLIRDSMGDWKQKANALAIKRLDPPTAPPRTDEQAAAITARQMVAGLPQVYWFLKLAHATPNYFEPFPKSSGPGGGLQSQRGSFGQAIVGDDEGLVVTLQPGGANYHSLVAHDYWFITRDVTKYQSSLAIGQAQPNADGTISYVVSSKDPGIANWIDTGGLHNPVLMIRLQGFPAKDAAEPWVTTRLVKLSELKTVLPAETNWVTPQQRAISLAKRKAEYEARMADH